MAPRQTGKQRSVRIPLDYFQKADGLTKGKAWLSAVAVVCCAFWLSGIGWNPREWSNPAQRSRALASHGVLARVHATWDTACEACHVPFTPIDGSSWAARLVADSHASDARCQACHAGPPHHASELTSDVPSCARCHQDHQGRDQSLVAIADGRCTDCHTTLSAHRKTGVGSATVDSVTVFDGDLAHHPEASLFRSGAANDPGTIKFNHALHLTKGLTLVTDGLPIKTVNDLSAADRNRYRSPDVGDAEGILLRCNSCHVLDAAGFPKPSGRDDQQLMRIPRAGGSYLLPIRYEAQCRACHPLDFDPKMPPVPHGKQPAELRKILRDAYAGQYMEQHPKLAASRPLSSPLPGREEEPEIRQAREWIEKNVATAERVLFSDKRCGECHDIAQPTPSAEHDVVVKGKIPALWFPKAAFDHSAHRAVGCRDCHARAYPDDPKASVVSADVMIPSLATCQRCHAPRREDRGGPTGGAGTRCTECHRYHNGDAPLEGLGAVARDAAAESSLGEFLKGSPGNRPR